MNRIWKYKESAIDTLPADLVAVADNLPILAKLLAIRGITNPQEAKAFLNIETYQPTPATEFPDMEKALSRMGQAIERQEPVLIYGDFDVDGVTGTSILLETLKCLKANVSFYIPDRHTEGHGMNSTALCRLVSSRQIKVVITTDTGITNFNEVNLLNGLGVHTIITDHHELPENLPEAYAILNPKLLPAESPLAYMSGAGVAFKFCEALLQAYNAPQDAIDALLEPAAIGTVVDMVPLLHENRYLVWRGLKQLQYRNRPGIRAMLREANVNDSAPITTQTIGFVLGPRLNAIGRLADASDAVTLMTTDDEEVARQLAAKLEQMNRRRKELVDKAFQQAETHLHTSGELTDQKAVILCSNEWNQGIVGLVATRLIEKYHRPCFIGFIDEEADEVRFSARSIDGFDMHHNLQALEDMFIRWGGHSGAAGFSIARKNLPTLKQRLFALCNDRISDQQLVPQVWVDMRLSPSQVNPHLVEIVERMAPFGQANPMPIFGLEGCHIGAHRTMGEDNRHLKLILTGDEPGRYLEAICWQRGAEQNRLDVSHTYRLAFTAEINQYNGTAKVQLIVKDFQDESLAALPISHPVSVSAAGETPAAAIAKSNGSSAASYTGSPAGLDNQENDGPLWVDHRNRTEIERFLSDILMAQAPSFHIFCEGTQQFFPLPVQAEQFIGRQSMVQDEPPADLLLWDLPPDLGTLTQLLEMHQPHRVHVIGGKYWKVPVYRPPQEFLQGFRNVLIQLWKQHQAQAFSIGFRQLATMLSTTQEVVLAGLSLLEQNEQLQARLLPDGSGAQVSLAPAAAQPVDIAPLKETLPYLMFEQRLEAVQRFREWLMSAPLDLLSRRVALEKLTATVQLTRKEPELNVLALR